LGKTKGLSVIMPCVQLGAAQFFANLPAFSAKNDLRNVAAMGDTRAGRRRAESRDTAEFGGSAGENTG
jgi:hypothetical protein